MGESKERFDALRWSSEELYKLRVRIDDLESENARLKAGLEKKEMLIRSNEAAWVRNHALIAKADRWRTLAGKMAEALHEVDLNSVVAPFPRSFMLEINAKSVSKVRKILSAYESAVKDSKGEVKA